MARREKVHGLVLSRRSVGEADRLVTLFTREMGLVRVLAKGVRKIPSRRGGHLEPLTRVLAVVSGHRGYFFLTAVETDDYLSALHHDRAAVASATVLARAIVGLFEREVAYAALYEAVRHAWETLPTLTGARRSLLEVATLMSLLREAGVLPRLDCCLQCGEGRPQQAVILDPAQGGWTCLRCLSARSHMTIQPGALTTLCVSLRGLRCLRYAVQYPDRAVRLALSVPESGQLQQALRRYLDYVVAAPSFAAVPSSHFGLSAQFAYGRE